MDVNPLVVLHIVAGSLGLVAGISAVATKKGSNVHRLSGKFFVFAMAIMCASAVCIAYAREIWESFFVGLLVFYLAVTGWLAVYRQSNHVGLYEYAALIYVIVVGCAALAIQLFSIEANDKPLYGVIVAAVVFVVGDVRTLLLGGLVGKQRIARHLWRMCVALLFSVISFGFQFQKSLPLLNHDLLLLGPGGVSNRCNELLADSNDESKCVKVFNECRLI